MKKKRIMSLLLAGVMILGILSGCKGREGEVIDTAPPEPTSDDPVYVYGVAGDMFRAFVNFVSMADMDSVRDYIAMDSENNIISNDDMMRYFMSMEIGNLIYVSYITQNIIVDNSGDTRSVTFKYMAEDGSANSFKMKVRIVGTEWKVVVDDLICKSPKLQLPAGNYTSITVDGHNIDMSKMKVDKDGNYVYYLPQIAANVEKTVIVTAADGRYCETTKKFYYEESSSGKVIDDGIEVIEATDFFVASQLTKAVNEGENS